MRRCDWAVVLTLVSHLLAWAAFLWLLFWPVYASGDTIVESEGTWVLILLLVPVVFTGLVIVVMLHEEPWSGWRKVVPSVGFLVFLGLCLISAASIGMFYSPSALLLGVAAWAAVWHSGGRTEHG